MTDQNDLYQSGPSTSDQFIRKWSLTLSGAGGSWTLSDSAAVNAPSGGTVTFADALRITFQTRQASVASRGTADITVFNLSLQNHPILAVRKIYNRVTLRAGYVNGRFATIFDGTIIDFKQGRDPDLTETYLRILAGDGDFPYNIASSRFFVPKGTPVLSAVKQVAQTMVDLGATLGQVFNIPSSNLIRGVVHHGMSTDELSKYADHFIQNGTLNISAPGNTYQVGAPLQINARSGLIGMAEINGANGVEFDCLLNPTLQVYGTVILNDADINVASGTQSDIPGTTTTIGPGRTAQPGFYVDPSADGTYKVLVVEHRGDSRGDDWASHVVAWPSGASPTPGSTVFQQYGLGPTPADISAATGPPQVPADPTVPTDMTNSGAF